MMRRRRSAALSYLASFVGFAFLEAGGPPPLRNPCQPFARDDPDHVRQARAAPTAAFGDDEQAVTGGQPDSVASQGDAHASPCGDSAQRQDAEPPEPYLVSYDPENGEMARRDPRRQRWGQWPAVGKPAASIH